MWFFLKVYNIGKYERGKYSVCEVFKHFLKYIYLDKKFVKNIDTFIKNNQKIIGIICFLWYHIIEGRWLWENFLMEM